MWNRFSQWFAGISTNTTRTSWLTVVPMITASVRENNFTCKPGPDGKIRIEAVGFALTVIRDEAGAIEQIQISPTTPSRLWNKPYVLIRNPDIPNVNREQLFREIQRVTSLAS